MHKILVRLPLDRDYAGLLEVQTPGGTRIAGPYEVCGRADDQLARSHRNPERDPLLPFGDIPYGEYRVAALAKSGAGTEYASEEYGSAGIVVLEPRNGDAALADANGRFRFLIQGGRPAPGGLRPTDGSLRLSNRDQRELIAALRRLERSTGTCLVVQAEHLRTRSVLVTPAVDEGRFAQVVSSLSMSGISRRSRTLAVVWLRAVMGLTGALVMARSALGFSAGNTQADPANDLRSVLSAKGASSGLSGKPSFTRGRLYAQGGGDYTQPAPEQESTAPAPQEQTSPAPDTSASDQLNNAATSSQNAAAASSDEEAKSEAGQAFDQGSQPAAPAPVAPAVPAPEPEQQAPQEETPAQPEEDTTPSEQEDETPAQQDEENQEEETPAPQQEEETPAPQEESSAAPVYSAPTPTYSAPAPAPAPAYQAPAYQQPAAPAPAVPQRGNLYVDPASFQKYLQPMPVQKAPAYDPAKLDAQIKGIKQALDRLKTVNAENLARSAEWMKASNDATKDAMEEGKNLTVDLLVARLQTHATTLDKEMQNQVDKIINTTDPAEKKALQEAFMANAEHKEQLQKAFERLELAHKGTDVLDIADKNYAPADSGEEKTTREKVNKQLENASDVLQLVAPGGTGLIKSYVDAGYDIWVQSDAVTQINSVNEGQTEYLQAVTVLTKRMQVLVDLKKKYGLPPSTGD